MQETAQREIQVCGLIRALSELDMEWGGPVQDDVRGLDLLAAETGYHRIPRLQVHRIGDQVEPDGDQNNRYPPSRGRGELPPIIGGF